mmetsp:Transcript_52653/g.140108  ORF Transcript_52653/g.140108 Transcript_52653/m.140108 type:complete len:224 (-) Transcript_52653:108-779(-)
MQRRRLRRARHLAPRRARLQVGRPERPHRRCIRRQRDGLQLRQCLPRPRAAVDDGRYLLVERHQRGVAREVRHARVRGLRIGQGLHRLGRLRRVRQEPGLLGGRLLHLRCDVPHDPAVPAGDLRRRAGRPGGPQEGDCGDPRHAVVCLRRLLGLQGVCEAVLPRGVSWRTARRRRWHTARAGLRRRRDVRAAGGARRRSDGCGNSVVGHPGHRGVVGFGGGCA